MVTGTCYYWYILGKLFENKKFAGNYGVVIFLRYFAYFDVCTYVGLSMQNLLCLTRCMSICTLPLNLKGRWNSILASIQDIQLFVKICHCQAVRLLVFIRVWIYFLHHSCENSCFWFYNTRSEKTVLDVGSIQCTFEVWFLFL